MPRLNTPTYLQHHHQLKELWLVHQRVFSYLSPSDQLDLHKYFQFASSKTEAELIEHRRNVHALDPSLPHCAGRACAKLLRGEQAPVPYTDMPDGRKIAVRVVMRPEPDLKLLAKALVLIAEREVKKRQRLERLLTRQAIRASGLPLADAA
jgi:hypothetical protein